MSGAEVLCTSRVAYPEAMAALARRWRQGDLDDESFGATREALAARAEGLAVLDADSDLYPFKAVAGDSSEVHEPGCLD